MARIRSIKPELRRSLTVATWPIPVRYAWVLLWGYLDDQGRGVDDMRLLVADLFPLDRDVTERKLEGWVATMAQAGPLCRYSDGPGRYLHAVNWAAHQRINRPQPSRIPPCPTHDPPHPKSPVDSLNGSVNDSVNGSLHDTVNGSLNDSLRARKEQGAGSREQGAGKSPTGKADTDQASPTAQQLVAAFCDLHPRRPPGNVVGQVGKLVNGLLAEGFDPDEISVGLNALVTRGMHPATLPSLVNELVNRPRPPSPERTGRPLLERSL